MRLWIKLLIIATWICVFKTNAQKKNMYRINYGEPPEEYIIGGVSVEGANFNDKNALISIAGFKVGEKIKIPGDDITKAIRKLWKLGIVGDVRIDIVDIEGNKVFLEIVLKERPRLSRYFYEGVPKGQMKTLDDKIKLVKGRIITEAMIKNAKNTIYQHFAEKGFKNCEVRIIQQKDTLLANSAYLKIIVDKKEKVKINDIAFTGLEQNDEKKVLRKMKKTKEKRFGRIFTPSKFVAKEYEEDKKKVVEYLNKEGFRNATILKDSVTDFNEKLVNIGISLYEGKRFYYRNIEWTGNYKYSDEVLSEVLGIKKGDVYNPEELSKRLNYNPNGTDVTSLYMDDGYLFFSVEPVEVLVEDDSIDIEMRMYEGEQATISKVLVDGNTKTNDHVIMREIRTLPGDKFSRADLIRTNRELGALGYFDPEKVGMNPKPNMADGTVDIHYTVEEKPSDQIELSGGWGGAFGFVGTVGLVFNNFSARRVFEKKAWNPLPAGDGQRLAVRMQASGRRFQTYSLSFTEPWLGGKKPNSFTISLSRSTQRNLDAFGRQLGKFNINEINFSLGRRLRVPDDFFTLINSLRFQTYQLNNFGLRGFGNYRNGDSYNITFNTTIARNSLDNMIYPRRGASLSLAINVTPPYSLFDNRRYTAESSLEERFRWAEYHKWMFDNSWFLPILDKLVLNARTHFGFISPYNKSKGLGPFERFIVGGDGLQVNNFLLGTDYIGLRGYQNNSILPAETSDLGGTVYNKYVLELRYALSMNPSATIWVHTFLEGGNNWARFNQFSPFDIKRSAGIGARIFMPAFGLLGVDWAYGYDEIKGRPNANGRQFHFTLGQQLR
ncbi:MAG: BamA/TamA family outer membrane protein [Flammeovirgaceae bacterium]|nr:BamA/TamA family outer membrane protein [Flammeovirgaceae bacterium]